MQDFLTLAWTTRQPILQTISPASLVASTLVKTLGERAADYAYVDFASGAGGPTPSIERKLNKALAVISNGQAPPAKFVLTDLHPHVEAWKAAAKKSENLSYVAEGVDAANAPTDLLKNVNGIETDKKIMRLFSLSFHHFDDELAAKILDNTLENADGFWYVYLT